MVQVWLDFERLRYESRACAMGCCFGLTDVLRFVVLLSLVRINKRPRLGRPGIGHHTTEHGIGCI